MFIFFSQAAIKQFHSLQVLFTGLLYLDSSLRLCWLTLSVDTPVSFITCTYALLDLDSGFPRLENGNASLSGNFSQRRLLLEGKKISAHENRLFINIASPLKKKTHHHWSYNRPWGTAEGGGLEVFFLGGGSTWFSGRTKWASVVANRVKRLSYRILTANERGL